MAKNEWDSYRPDQKAEMRKRVWRHLLTSDKALSAETIAIRTLSILAVVKSALEALEANGGVTRIPAEGKGVDTWRANLKRS